MFEGLNRWLSKKQEAEMAVKISDDPTKPRTKNPDLPTWMGEAGSAGLDGEVGNGEEFNVSVGDLKNQPDVAIAGTPDRHGLHLVTPEEGGEPVDGDVLGEPAANSEVVEVETPDPTETKLMNKLIELEAAAAIVREELLAVRTTNEIKKAKDKVDRVAA